MKLEFKSGYVRPGGEVRPGRHPLTDLQAAALAGLAWHVAAPTALLALASGLLLARSAPLAGLGYATPLATAVGWAGTLAWAWPAAALWLASACALAVAAGAASPVAARTCPLVALASDSMLAALGVSLAASASGGSSPSTVAVALVACLALVAACALDVVASGLRPA